MLRFRLDYVNVHKMKGISTNFGGLGFGTSQPPSFCSGSFSVFSALSVFEEEFCESLKH